MDLTKVLLAVIFAVIMLSGCGLFEDAGKPFVGKWSGQAPKEWGEGFTINADISHVQNNKYLVKTYAKDSKKFIPLTKAPQSMKMGS